MNALPLVLFGLLCAGLGAALTAYPYWRVLEIERQERAIADRMRRHVGRNGYGEVRW